jgi:hypothetical protein
MDWGQPPATPASTKSGPATLGGTTSKSGMSPVALDYTVDLTFIPSNSRIVAAQANYTLAVSGASFTDSGGSSAPGSTSVTWGADGIALLNAAMGGTANVHATGSWSGSPPVAVFSVSSFAVSWVEPQYP